MRRPLKTLASKLSGIRPKGNGSENAERRTWADCVNAVIASGLVPEAQIREFRQNCGWESELDKAVMP